MNELKKLLIVDGYSVIAKIYYSLPFDMNSKGRHTNALRGVTHVLRHELDDDETDAVCCVFGSKDGLMNSLFQADYLQQSQHPDGLLEQIDDILTMLKNAGVYVVEQENETARELVYGITKQAMQEKVSIRILTADECLLCLVNENTEVVIPQVQDKMLVWNTYNIEQIQEKHGIEAKRILLVKALNEDHSSIRIGKGYATELAGRYADLEEVYQHIDEIESQHVKQILLEGKAIIQERFDKLRLKGSFQGIENLKETQHYELTDEVIQEAFAKAGILAGEAEEREDTGVSPKRSKVTWSYRLEKIQNIKQADTIWQACMESGVTGLQLLAIKGQEDTQVLASANGQMFLQFGEDTSEDIICVALTNTNYPDTVFWMSSDEVLTEDYIRSKLTEFAYTGKGTFATFDVKTEYEHLLDEEKMFTLKNTEKIFDIKIAAYLLNPLKSDYQIQDIASEYLNLEMDSWKDLFGKADSKGAYLEQKEKVIAYYARIAWVASKVCDMMEQRLMSEGMKSLYRDIEMPLTYVLYDMEREGIKIKPEALKQYGDSLQVRILELEQIIYQESGETFNINSPKQLGEVLFEKLGLPGGKKTKTGYSTAADVLEGLAQEYPLVNDILEYRQLTKLKSTYADGLANYIAEDGRIHTSFNQTITATGRLSSTEPNLQNIPMRMELGRLIRKVFVPKRECVFMDADYSQIELRVLAHMSEDQNLIEAYQMSEDIHRITASQVFHTPFEEVTDLQRRNAKAVNFGIVYGISSFGLSQGLSITRQEATEYIERYFETYPGVKSFLDRLVSEAKLSGKSKSMFGRIRPIPELLSSNYMQRQFGERVAMNAPIQGTAADIIKIAMIKVWKGLQEAGLKSKLILQIHDELLIETYEEEKEQVQHILASQMQEAAKLSVALDIDLHTGADWYEAK